jgi:serine/threonine protein phosphatase PrpC
MSTHSDLPAWRRGIARFAFSILGGLLLALQLVLSPVAFAASAERMATPALTQQGVLDLAGVSVVRLVVEYTQTPTRATVQCTGLGTLVGSWSPLNSTDKNNWVLTDDTLVNQRGQTCLPKIPGHLTRITIYANTLYTNTPATPVTLGQLQCSQNQAQQTSCRDTLPETLSVPRSGAVAFSFRTESSHLQPFLTVAGQQGVGLLVGIELATAGSTPPPWPAAPETSGILIQPQQYLVPRAVPQTSNTKPGSSNPTSTPTSNALQLSPPNEPGMPIVNSDGNMVGMNLTGGNQLDGQTLLALLNQQPEFQPAVQSLHKNSLNSQWVQGISQYEAGNNYTAAQNTFKQLEGVNPLFQAPLAFEQKAAHLSSTQGGQQGSPAGGNPVTSSDNTTFFGIARSTFFIIGIGAGILLLMVILIIVSMWARRRHELARFEAERAEAQRNAEREVQQIQQSKATAKLQYPVTELPCPNCGTLVQTTEAFCPHCRFLLSASASGLHLQATPPPSVAPQPQANNVQPSKPPASAISDLPTMEFSPANGYGSVESETTLQYNIQELQSPNLSLVVGYLTDPGIKRKHRPNEDSLFAMQGARTHNSLPQEFGLFVVADGMGGHANGQDASRLAIQTIINYMLPRISTNDQVDDVAFLNLLRDGVQNANQAVHQRNMEERADMGTTMTAALVVGAIAYVANVGDSRTYLYHEPEGLTKITQDHSVVASLVEAGIIKPDDIYTHPKRNQIYRSLGEKSAVDVDSFRVSLQAGDKLLLCSDGLWDMVRDPDIQRLMSAPVLDPSKTGKKLIQAALDGGGEDNVSVIVVAFSEAKVPASSKAGLTGVQLLYKPETVTVPDLPQM